MRKATGKERNKVVEILTTAFGDNPGVNWMFTKRGNHRRKVRRLARYAFTRAFLRDGVFTSPGGKSVALCYRYDKKVFSVAELFYQTWFALSSIPLRHIPGVLRREAYREHQRPRSEPYLYFWFFGALPGAGRAAFEVKDAVLEAADRAQLPIYLETTLERNKKIYERYGFTTYHYWEDKTDNIKFWFMRREPSPLN